MDDRVKAMEPPTVKPWYKKARYIVPLGLAAVALTASAAAGNPATTSIPTATQTATVGNFAPANPPQVATTTSTTTTVQTAPAANTTSAQIQSNTQTVTPTTNLSNDNYYTNVSGNQVHSPANTTDNTIPAGASARCNDGTYSFSQHRSGTCSHHGGVATWY
jgi:hypothetical protein